jgi:hypothetical protein
MQILTHIEITKRENNATSVPVPSTAFQSWGQRSTLRLHISSPGLPICYLFLSFLSKELLLLHAVLFILLIHLERPYIYTERVLKVINFKLNGNTIFKSRKRETKSKEF